MRTKEIKKMTADIMIELWNDCDQANSDLHSETENMIEKIINHIENCNDCKIEMDCWLNNIPVEKFDFFYMQEKFSNTELSNWICQ